MFTLQSMTKNTVASDSSSPKDSSGPNVNSKENTPKTHPNVTINLPPSGVAVDDSLLPMDISGGILLRTIQRRDEPFTNLAAGTQTGFSSPGATFNSYSTRSTGQLDSYTALVERIAKGCGSLNKHQLTGYHGTNYNENSEADSKSEG